MCCVVVAPPLSDTHRLFYVTMLTLARYWFRVSMYVASYCELTDDSFSRLDHNHIIASLPRRVAEVEYEMTAPASTRLSIYSQAKTSRGWVKGSSLVKECVQRLRAEAEEKKKQSAA